MLSHPFETVIRKLCEEILSETDPRKLPQKIIQHVESTFPVEWATLWLTEQKDIQFQMPGSGSLKDKQLKLAAATKEAIALMTAEKGQPAVYDFGEGLTGYIAESGRIVNITNPNEFEKHTHSWKYDKVMYGKAKAEDSCRCVLGVPLLLNSTEKSEWRIIGVLKLENIKASSDHKEAFFTDKDVEIVNAYASVIAVALEKAQMKADSMRIGNGLLEISKMLLASLGEKPDITEIVKRTATVISAQACALWRRNGNQLVLDSSYGYPGESKNIPPYDNILIRNDNYQGVGLTVYVANTLLPLNLESKEAIKTHVAWKGANDTTMWLKKQGEACYSLVAIPLKDDETMDLKGVFKIENKQPTIFQLENYFTKEDQQLLETLGNSISLSLMIYERFNRLKRLEKLVSDFRILNGLEEALFFILTGLTHNVGLQYNRAMAFMKENSLNDDEGYLVCKFSVGCLDLDDWSALIKQIRDGHQDNSVDSLNIDVLLKEFNDKKNEFFQKPLAQKWNGLKIPLKNSKNIIATYAKNATATRKYISEWLAEEDIFHGFSFGDFVLIPIAIDNNLIAIIYADNFFTGNRINSFETQVLDLFAGMAAAIINASTIPDKLRLENESAWKEFSQPAAHRLGTETAIIGGEVDFIQNIYLPKTGVLPTPPQIENIQKSLFIINYSVARLREATNDYKQLTPEPELYSKINIIKVLETAVKTTIKSKTDINIQTNFSNPIINIVAQSKAIKYVFEELLLNADKEFKDFSEKKPDFKPLIKIIAKEAESQYSVFIGDNGRGIPKELLKALFCKQVQGRQGGTGLGLFLIQRILSRNGGTIKLLDSNTNQCTGACFLITFQKDFYVNQIYDPILNTEKYTINEETPFTAHTPPIDLVSKPCCPFALVLEDTPLLQRQLIINLSQNGIACIVAANEEEALKNISGNVTIIIADICLTGNGGRDDGGIVFARKIKKNGSQIPIVLISQTPDKYLPHPSKTLEYNKTLDELGVKKVFNRNDSDFYLNLIKAIQTGI